MIHSLTVNNITLHNIKTIYKLDDIKIVADYYEQTPSEKFETKHKSGGLFSPYKEWTETKILYSPHVRWTVDGLSYDYYIPLVTRIIKTSKNSFFSWQEDECVTFDESAMLHAFNNFLKEFYSWRHAEEIEIQKSKKFIPLTLDEYNKKVIHVDFKTGKRY